MKATGATPTCLASGEGSANGIGDEEDEERWRAVLAEEPELSEDSLEATA